MLTALEKAILRELARNPRASFRELARKVGLAPATLIKRVRELEKKGIVRGYSAVADFEKLGYGLTAIIEVQSKRGHQLKAEKKLARTPGVFAIYDVTGTYDFVVIAKFRHRDELMKFVRKLLMLEPVERTNTRVVLETVKEDFASLEGRL